MLRVQTVFDAPEDNDPVVLDLGSMGKGEAWINGESIGRYWVSFHTSDGSPSQRWLVISLVLSAVVSWNSQTYNIDCAMSFFTFIIQYKLMK